MFAILVNRLLVCTRIIQFVSTLLPNEKSVRQCLENPTYVQEVDYRVEAMEEYYIRRRLKLLHIQARLKAIGKQD